MRVYGSTQIKVWAIIPSAKASKDVLTTTIQEDTEEKEKYYRYMEPEECIYLINTLNSKDGRKASVSHTPTKKYTTRNKYLYKEEHESYAILYRATQKKRKYINEWWK